MKLILLDGGPASGKNTLGMLLIQDFQKRSDQAILLDLDTYVEELNPTWVWTNKQKEEEDQQKARVNFASGIDRYLQENYVVIAIGKRFLTREDITTFINRLKITTSIYLYHLSTPFFLRRQRLHERGPHSLINLEKDQQERDSNPKWYGCVYENTNSPTQDARNIFKLIQDNKGLIKTNS